MTTQWKYSNIYKTGVYRTLDNGAIEMAEAKDLPQGTVILDPDVDHEAEKAAVLAEFRTLRDTALSRLNGIQLDSTVQSDIDAIKIAKQGLKDMPQNASVVAAVGGDATEEALQVIYFSIAAQLAQSSPSAYTAFRGLDM